MTTALTQQSFMERLRMIALAGTIALSALVPVAPGVLASGEDTVTPVSVDATTGQFDVDASAGLEGLQARVNGDGDGVNLRAAASHDADVVQAVSDGTVVDLRIDMLDTVYDDDGITRWWPVSVGGTDGWIAGFYLTDVDGISVTVADADKDAAPTVPEVTTTRVPYDYTGDFVPPMYAEVSADGDGLVLRAEPSRTSEKLDSLSDGTTVQLRIDILDTVYDEQGTRWWPVEVNGVQGWVSGFYLIDPGAEPTTTVTTTTIPTTRPVTEEPAADDGVSGDFAAGDWAELRTSDGDGIALRAGASANSDESGFAPNQALVEILSGPENGWYEVRWDRQVGYVDGALLVPATAPTLVEDGESTTSTSSTADVTAPSARTATDSAEPASFASGDAAQVDAGSDVGVNVRETPSTDADRTGFLDEGVEVQITGGPETDDDDAVWYRITDGAVSGWVRGDLLVPVDEPETAQQPQSEREAAQTAAAADEDAGFVLPVANYRFTQDYGCSSLGFYVYDASIGCSVHDGVDLAATSGTPVYAVAAGEVVAAGWCDCGLGYYVEIDHGNGLHTVYGHLASQPTVSVGQQVSQGDVVGPVGSTGLSTGPHLHFMVRQDGVTQDPKNYLPALS